MSAKRGPTLALRRLWADSREAREPFARTPDERTTACFHEHARRITQMLQHIYPQRDVVEDAVQDAFLRLHKALTRDEEIEHLGAWVYTVAKNELISAARRANHQERTSYKHNLAVLAERWMDTDASVTPEDLFLDQSRGEKLREALLSLPDLERQCLEARADGLTLAEVGRIVRLDLRRVSEIVRRAVVKLQSKLHD